MPNTVLSPSSIELPPREWHARLALTYAQRDSRTVIVRREHVGPLRVQRPFYPEGAEVCHSYLLHPPGGIANGDRIEASVRVGDRAHVVLTTPGAAKWYRSAGAWAYQDIDIVAGSQACVEWLPHETIAFAGARATGKLRVELAADARYIGWEVTCLGRAAAGERFSAGHLRQETEVVQAGVCRWHERVDLAGGSRLLDSPAGLRGHAVSGLLLAAGADPAHDLVTACRAVAMEGAALCGVTALPGVLVARYLGPSSEQAMHYFRALWAVLRPAMMRRPVCPPRIWNT